MKLSLQTRVKEYEMWILMVVVIFFLLKDSANGIKLTEVLIPKHAIKDHSVALECYYDMEGEALYSVKWYKDGYEFYRYVPRDEPPIQIFPLIGIHVNMRNSTNNKVMLETIDLSSSGRYRCEVSAEAPSFQTVTDNGEMVVVVLPEVDPHISGGKPRYQIDDYVRINCTSGRAKPPVHLSWYINGDPADLAFVKPYPNIISGSDMLETTTLGLKFRVKPKHFKHGDMKLKCLATISTVYWKSNEESVEGDKPHNAPMLESRKAAKSVTRADRVQASNNLAANNSSTFSSTFCFMIIICITHIVVR